MKQLSGWRWIGLLTIAAAAIWLSLRGYPDGKLHIYFLNVGQGDAILVQAPDGRQVLVDGGPSPIALLSELGEVLPFWDRSLDLVVLTHPDADHMTGLISLLDRYRVGQALDASAADATPLASAWSEGLEKSGTRRHNAERGALFALGDLLITVLHPAPMQGNVAAGHDNNNSVVLRLEYGQTSALLTGDIELEAETALIEAGVSLRADVLKVAHHGSARSTSARFVSAVAPSLAVIQVGADNEFGHPTPEVLDRLAGIRVLRTDLNGRVEVISDGHRLWFRTQRR